MQQLTGTGISAFASLGALGLKLDGSENGLAAVTANTTSNDMASQALDAALGSTETKSEADDAHNPSNSDSVENSTKFILIKHMFDKDLETEENWHEDIREEFVEECTDKGITDIVNVHIQHKLPEGRVLVEFASVEMAVKCRNNLQGRFFDGRKLAVDFLLEESAFKEELSKNNSLGTTDRKSVV